jgi:RNA polymerase sigma-70 factor (ECF subfamily)
MSPTAPKDGEPALSPMNAERTRPSERRAVHAPDEDLELVRRTQAGDRVAFRALFDKYHRRVFAIAMGVVKNPQDANDVTQEAFVKVFKHISGFEGASSFYTWLYRITMNLSIDLFRRKKTARAVDYDDAVGRDPDDLEDPANIAPTYLGGDPAKAHSRKELLGKLEGALRTLPPYHQQVLMLREVDGLSYEEIANVMQIPKGTVMSRLFHARRKMQAALAGYVDGDLTPKTDSEGEP